ncbi:L-threonylcarbamoyladenylate synthase [Thermaurantiacus sp.]
MATTRPPRAADAHAIADVVRHLGRGGIAVVPTETVYGLAADAASPEAVARVFRAKGRPAANPLIVHVTGQEMAALYAEIPPLAARLMTRFWPGPLTLVLPKRADAPLADAVTAGLATVALRAPDHPVMQAVIAGLGRGVAAPSANVSGRLSPTRAEHVHALDVPLVLDAGPCRLGVESSVLKVDRGRLLLLRPGSLDSATLAEAAGVAVEAPGNAAAAPEAPGMAFRHYAPRLPLDLDVTEPAPGRFLLGFGAIEGDFNLSPAGDVTEAAATLFDALHRAEASGKARIGVAPIPDRGVGAAIRDRLARAAAAAGGTP